MARKILDELKCAGCRRKLSAKQRLYETAWGGVYWCGAPICAHQIMWRECKNERLKVSDSCNWDD